MVEGDHPAGRAGAEASAGDGGLVQPQKQWGGARRLLSCG